MYDLAMFFALHEFMHSLYANGDYLIEDYPYDNPYDMMLSNYWGA